MRRRGWGGGIGADGDLGRGEEVKDTIYTPPENWPAIPRNRPVVPRNRPAGDPQK